MVDQWSTPAHWLDVETFLEASRQLRSGDFPGFFRIQLTDAPPDSADVDLVSVAETLSLLGGHGINIGNLYRLPEAVANLLSVEEASVAASSVERFLVSATDETLSDDSFEYLTLCQGKPQVIRETLSYLLEKLRVPASYGGVLILSR
jgi:hypothetical protein